MDKVDLQPDDESVKRYYEKLQEYQKVDETHEGTVRAAFQHLLEDVGQDIGWTLVQEHYLKERSIRVDGALKNEYNLYHGYWEAKDSDDDLDEEVKKKLEKDYPTKNTVFQAPNRAVLIQDGGVVFDGTIEDPQRLTDLLKRFFQYREPAHDDWERAVEDFKGRVPEIGEALRGIIETELEENQRFQDAFQSFFEECKQAINPDLARDAVKEMLIQHLLTERIFRTVFNNPDFVRRNVIASEIEEVIEALTSRSFSREEFLQQLDRFYIAIEEAAEAAEDFSEKQEFLNNIYEQFFQGFAVDVADTHGIVYTPQPIVDFMVNSVSGLLEEEFDVGIGDEDVHVLDPFVGTGNFIVRTMKEIPRRKLPQKYGAEGDPELHANEVMLLPYYVASMNIEHEYYDRIGNYSPFEGICLVDTFELAEGKQHSAFSPENTKRIEYQTNSPIRVVIGNPPYNAWQVNANDNNQNREYEIVDERVRRTYSADSNATNKNPLYDPYVKSIRWASDRVKNEGIVALVTKRTFIDKKAFDGMRKHLESDFDAIYVLDCGGSVHDNPKLSGTTHNVFGIRNGVSINFLVKRKESTKGCDIHYHCMDEYLRKEERFEQLDQAGDWSGIDWEAIEPDDKNRWLTDPLTQEFEGLLPLGSKQAKKAEWGDAETIFKTYSNGLKTSKDAYVYDFDRDALADRMEAMTALYNEEVERWARLDEEEQEQKDVREFLRTDDEEIKWSRTQRRNVERGRGTTYDSDYFRKSMYRPYSQKWLYFDPTLMEMTYLWSDILPNKEAEEENRFICTVTEKQLPFSAQMTNLIPALHYGGRQTQCFPFYVYDEDEADRCGNITDWAVEQFRSHYEDVSIEKSDIFYYVYAVLHHPRA